MKLRLVAVALVALILPLSAGAAPAFKVTFTAPTHTPKVNAKWPWQLKVTDLKGKPIAAVITVQIVDPVGGVHPVEFGCCKKKYLTNIKFSGVFRDYVRFPLASKAYRLTFRVIVKALGAKKTVNYWVQSR